MIYAQILKCILNLQSWCNIASNTVASVTYCHAKLTDIDTSRGRLIKASNYWQRSTPIALIASSYPCLEFISMSTWWLDYIATFANKSL